MIRKSKFYSYIIVLIFILLIIVFPDISSNGVSRGLLISANVIIPSLFPFMICVLMLIKSGFSINNRVVNKVLYVVFGHSFDMFFAFLLSMLGGYPIGARLINEMYKQNAIDKKTANIMLMYCVNAGPAFIISVVGNGLYNSRKIGIVLLVSHIATSIFMAIYCGRLLKKHNCQYKSTIKSSKNFSEIFVESVSDSSSAILQICCFVILFSAVNSYFDLFFGNMSIIKYVSFFTEVTYAITKTKNIFFISFLLGFSGLSIWCQIFAMSSGRKINYFKFCFVRILHGIISSLLTKILIKVFKVEISTFNNNVDIINSVFYSNITISISLAIMLIVLLVFMYTKNSSGKFIKDVI